MRISKVFIVAVFTLVLCIGAFSQPAISVEEAPLAVTDIMDIFALRASDEDRNRVALDWVRKRCVDFVDDGTNYWVITVLGGSKELITEIDSCLTWARRNELRNHLKRETSQQAYRRQIILTGDLVRQVYKQKDVAGRKKFITAGKEFLRRYSEDAVAKEPVEWLKVQIPRIETQIQSKI